MQQSSDKEIDGQHNTLLALAGILHLPARYSCGQGFQQWKSYLHSYFVTGEDV
jgi:hypothetical protein